MRRCKAYAVERFRRCGKLHSRNAGVEKLRKFRCAYLSFAERSVKALQQFTKHIPELFCFTDCDQYFAVSVRIFRFFLDRTCNANFFKKVRNCAAYSICPALRSLFSQVFKRSYDGLPCLFRNGIIFICNAERLAPHFALNIPAVAIFFEDIRFFIVKSRKSRFYIAQNFFGRKFSCRCKL